MIKCATTRLSCLQKNVQNIKDSKLIFHCIFTPGKLETEMEPCLCWKLNSLDSKNLSAIITNYCYLEIRRLIKATIENEAWKIELSLKKQLEQKKNAEKQNTSRARDLRPLACLAYLLIQTINQSTPRAWHNEPLGITWSINTKPKIMTPNSYNRAHFYDLFF